MFVVVERAASGEPIGSAADVGGPLSVGSLAHGEDAAVGVADVVGQEGEVGQSDHAIRSDGVGNVVEAIHDGGFVGAGEQVGGADDVIRRDASGGDGCVVDAFELVSKGVVTFGVLGEPFGVSEAFVDDSFQDGADEHQLGARDWAQPEIGVAGQLHFSDVDDDERGTGLGGLFDGHADDVVAFGEVGVEDEDAAGLCQVPDGVGGAGVSEYVFQPADQRGLGVTGVVDIVGVHAEACEFLGEVKLLVGAVGSGDETESGAVLVRSELFGNQVEGLVPGGGFQLTVAANQGSAQPLAAGDMAESELALVASLAVIGRRVEFGHGADDPALLILLQVDLAADRAMGADGALDAGGFFPLVVPLGECAYGTDVDAGTAEFAARFQQGGAEGGTDQRVAGALGEADGVVAAHFFAGANAAATGDAKVEVAIIERVLHFEGNIPVYVGHGRFQLHAEVPDGVLEFAAFVFGAGYAAVVDGHVAQANVRWAADVDAVAGEAAVGMFSNQHFHYGTAEFGNVWGIAPDGHAVGYGESAGCREAAATLDGDHAHPAGPERLHARVVAEVGDVDAGLDGRFQHHLAWLGSNLDAVDRDDDVVRHWGFAPGRWMFGEVDARGMDARGERRSG